MAFSSIIGIYSDSERYLWTILPFFRPSSQHGSRWPSRYRDSNGTILIVGAELDRLIHEKRSHLKEALAAYQKTRDAVALAQMRLAEFVRGDESDFKHTAPEVLRDPQAAIYRLECEERDAAARFNAISDELAQLHREKYGEWHITWRGPLSSP